MTRTPPQPAPRVPVRRVSRRAALAGTGVFGAGLLVGGCSIQNPFDEDEKQPAEKAVPKVAPDVGLAIRATTQVLGAQALVEAVVARHPGQRARLAGLLEMHAAHLRSLTDAVPDDVDVSGPAEPPVARPRPARAVEQVVAREQRLHDRLSGFALAAESGPFARLLGSMAASVSQHLAVLAPGARGNGGAA